MLTPSSPKSRKYRQSREGRCPLKPSPPKVCKVSCGYALWVCVAPPPRRRRRLPPYPLPPPDRLHSCSKMGIAKPLSPTSRKSRKSREGRCFFNVYSPTVSKVSWECALLACACPSCHPSHFRPSARGCTLKCPHLRLQFFKSLESVARVASF